MSTVFPSSSRPVTVSSVDKRFVTVDRQGRKPCCLVIISESWDKQLFFEDFVNDGRTADGSDLPWVCCAGGFATGVTIALQGPEQFGVTY